MGDKRDKALKQMLEQLTKRGNLPLGKQKPSHLEETLAALPENRQRILLLVGSYREARLAHEYLETQPNWRGKSLTLVSDDEELEDTLGIQRGLVDKFASTNAEILIAPLLAIERGHNILNSEDKAAFGAAYFLIRPHPHPHDITYAIQSINRWAIAHCDSEAWSDRFIKLSWIRCRNPLTFGKIGKKFHKDAFSRWWELIRLKMRYSTLPPKEREAVTWNQLVVIWQVIGRLIRGGCPARVYFCDIAFVPPVQENQDVSETSLLFGMVSILNPYFTKNKQISEQERQLVKALYEPLYSVLKKLTDNL